MGYTKLNLFYEALNAFGKEYAMADTKNELMNEDDRVIVTLEDETGEKVDYEFLDVIEYDNEEYLILTKFNPNIDSDVYDVVIFLINPINDEDEEYIAIDDDTLNTVFEIFKEKYEGEVG